MTNSTDTETAATPPSNSIGVSEHIAAIMLGVSLSSIRRDRRDGRLGGVPYFKLGEGKRAAVRYVVADLEQFIAKRKKRGTRPVRAEQAPAALLMPALPAFEPFEEIEPVEQIEPPRPVRRSPRNPWRYTDEPEEDPFATGCPGPRQPRRYWTG